MELDTETPWSWREGRLDRHTNPLKGDLREYRSGIQELMIRSLETNRHCADCGVSHNPKAPIDIATPATNGVAYANPWLGVFLCNECALCHEQLLPSPINKILYAFYNLHQWTLDDVAQIAAWGNLRAQRYWLGKYRSDIDRLPEIIKPNRSAMTRKQWILRKYHLKEWKLDSLPTSPNSLLHQNPFELRCFKQLRIVNRWVPPPSKSHSSLPTPEPSKPAEIPQKDIKDQQAPTVSSAVKMGYKDVVRPAAGERILPGGKKSIRVTTAILSAKDLKHPHSDTPISHPSPSKNNSAETNHTTQNNPSSTRQIPPKPIVKPPPSPVKRPISPSSEYSDDLYGTGRPLRPNLINPSSKIHAWRISSIGNPPLSVSPPLPWDARPLPAPQLKGNDLQGLGLLIPMEGAGWESGETITEEDSSLLAELNEAFVHPGVLRGGARAEEGMEDVETDVESEMGKIVLEFEGGEGRKEIEEEEGRGEEVFEMEDLGGRDDCCSDDMGSFVAEEVLWTGDLSSLTEFEEGTAEKEDEGIMMDEEEAPATATSHHTSKELTSTAEITQEDAARESGLQETATETPSQSPQPVHSCPNNDTDLEGDLVPSVSIRPSNENASDMQPTKRSDPFATVISGLKVDRRKVSDTSHEPNGENVGKTDLRLFILESGLFSR